MSDTKSQKTESKTDKSLAPRQRVILRELKKGVFFYPIAIYSFIAALIEDIGESGNPSQPWTYANVLSIIWVVIFFANIFVVSFDFSAGKFVFLILGTAIILLVVFLLIQGGTIILPLANPFVLNLEMRTQFFWMMAAIIGAVVLLTVLMSFFRFVRIEPNEVLVKGILGDVKRFPTGDLRYEKKITDVFEYMALRAGTIKLFVAGKASPVELRTVARVQTKARQMDAILSRLKIAK